MSKHLIDIKALEPLRVATVTINSATPEQESVETLLNWARTQQGLLRENFRFFGYDSCEAPPNHTYTTWITVPNDVEASENIKIEEFAGGQYATVECNSVEEISPLWKELTSWLDASEYTYGDTQALEEHLDVLADSPHRFRLYLPIKK